MNSNIVNTKKSKKENIISDTSLVCTVYNEANNIEDFLNSIFSMNFLPSEIVIVDGGSTDKTSDIIDNYFNTYHGEVSTRLIIDNNCNIKFTPAPIAKGRNIAISNASNNIIITTDAGCIIDKNWLKNITEPFMASQNIDVVGGWYKADVRSYLEKLFALVLVMPDEKATDESFIPSSRSFAFKKMAWKKVGGYPENSYWAEDTLFVLHLRKAGFKFTFINNAFVYWRMRSNIFTFIKVIRNYGFGEGYNKIMIFSVLKNILKLIILFLLIFGGIYISPFFFICLLIYLWLLPFYKRFNKAFELNNILSLPLLIFLKVTSDFTYIAGYIIGRIARYRKRKIIC